MHAKDGDFLPRHVFILDRLPISLRNNIVEILIKLKIIKKYGKATLVIFDENGKEVGRGKGFNTIVDAGLKELGDLLLAVKTNTMNNLNIGTSNDVTNPTLKTDLVAPAAPTERLAILSGGRFRSNKLLTFTHLIPSTKYTRPVTIQEMAIYFDPNTTGTMFARAVISPVTLQTGYSARFDYEISL